MENKRKIYVKKLEAELKKWAMNAEKFRKKAIETKASAKTAVQKQIQVLRAKQKKAQEKLRRLRSSGGSAWTDLKGGAEKALAELRISVRNAVAKFK